MPVIVIGNHKGGVGKTMITTAFAAALAMRGHRVLCIDLDPQGNLTRRLGYAGAARTKLRELPSAADVMEQATPDALAAAIVPAQWEPDWADNVYLVPGHVNLELRNGEAREPGAGFRLRESMRGLDPEIIVLIDTPPSMGHAFTNAVATADHLIAIAHPELDPVEGIGKIDTYLDMNRAYLETSCRLDGVIINGVRRNLVHQTLIEKVRQVYGERLWEPTIAGRQIILDNGELGRPPQLGNRAATVLFNTLTDRLQALYAPAMA